MSHPLPNESRTLIPSPAPDPPPPPRDHPQKVDLASTQHLLEGLHDHQPAAWGEFADKYLPILRARATRRLSFRARRLDETWDIVQDVVTEFLAQVEKVQYVHTGALREYLVSMVRKHLADAENAARRRPDPEPIDLDQIPAPEPPAMGDPETDRLRRAMRAALARLTEEERQAVILKARGRKARQIVRALGRPDGDTARTFIRRAVRKYEREFERLRKAPA